MNPESQRQLATSAQVARLVRDAMTLFDTDLGAARRRLCVASSLLTRDLDVEQAARSAREPAHSLARWQANAVIDYIESNLEAKIQVRRLAKMVSLSASHFSRAFRLELGLPPMAYVKMRRLERAKVMMTSSEGPLSHVALACGFADQSHFTRCFRRVVGLTPGRYRRDKTTLRHNGRNL